MKKIILFLLLVSFSIVFAQKDYKRGDKHFSKRFEELQKLQLIETLNLDEASTLKFFARRNTHNNNVEEIKKDEKQIVLKMEEILKIGGSNEQYDRLLNELINNENKLLKERSRFINSLDDVLTKEQIVKMLLFERQFREHVKDLLIEKGRKRFFKERSD